MYFRLLKNELKRKKTMNIVLLLFVILAAMFAASSVSNIITVTNGLDYFFDKAGMTDYYFISSQTNENNNLSKILDEESSVSSYKKENIIFASASSFKNTDNEKLTDFSNSALIISIDDAKLNYFDSNNEIINRVDEGKVYFSSFLANKSGLKIGDKLKLNLCDTSLELEYAGMAKDAFLGSDMIGNPRCILNDKDYQKLYENKLINSGYLGEIYYVNTDNISALESATADCDNLMFQGSDSTIRATHVLDMIIAGLLLVVSVCLILVSFVVLKFTIGFTINEEFREIGVMKAIGIRNNSIRGLYLVKYLGIAVIGSVIGYIASIPFGNIMLSSISQNMVLGNDNSFIIGVLCSIAVIGIIMLFCWSCTRKIKKMSPIDAVRNGQTGERFRKKSIIHLGKSRLGTNGFLAINDVLSSPKQFSIITLVFTICISLVIILANTANTLNSEKLLFLFGTTKSDLYFNSTSRVMDVMGGSKTFKDEYKEIENLLSENNMPGKVHIEKMFKIPVTSSKTKINVMFQQCSDTKASDYTYSQGTAPKYENEIAITEPIAERLGVGIGDKVKLNICGEEKEYIVSALFQSFCQLGDVGRLHESVSIPDNKISSSLAFQIDFDDKPNSKEIENRKEKLKDIFDTQKIFDAEEFVKDSTGAADTVNGTKNLVLIISLLITAMISILMEHSFITKEKSEIALMKAMGFKSRSVIAQHTLRFVIVSIIAAIISLALSLPLTKLCINPIFSFMGAVSGIEYEIKPFEVFVIYPIIILVSIIAGTFFTSLHTKAIKASDTSDIE